MIKQAALFFISLLFLTKPGSLIASPQTDTEWVTQLKKYQLDPKEQSYCFSDDRSSIEGHNIHSKVRLASVSKLMISLWSLETLGFDYKFKTKLLINGNNLHIKGSLDPFLGEEKLFFLLSQLNDLNYFSFNSISFDSDFLIDPNPYTAHGSYPNLSPTIMKSLIKKYFNTNAWNTELKNSYNQIRLKDKSGRLRKNVSFEVSSINFIEQSPFENDPETRTLTLSSPELYKYLKQINIVSHNYASENIFKRLGGDKELELFFNKNYSLGANQIYFYTGSGLPLFKDNKRFDNYASCSIILKLLGELKKSIELQSKEMEDVIAVPGSDAGTFRNRIFPSDFKNSFVAKTGTLMHTSTLAGAMSTASGISFFGIFNQTTEVTKAKMLQNAMVAAIMNDLGGPKSFDYTVDVFYSYNEENVKNFNFLSIIDPQSEFTSIGENLY